MISRRAAALVAASILLGIASTAGARRLPSAGGDAIVAVPDGLRDATIEAHTTTPLLERVPDEANASERLARPALPDRPEWRSALLRDLRSSEDFTTWTLEASGPADAVAQALSRCLGPSWWAGRAMTAAGVSSSVSVRQISITITFGAPVGPVPELLSTCPVEGGGWLPGDGGRLASKGDGQALLDRIVIADALADADVASGDPSRTSAASLTAQAPDVLLLLQDEDAREADAVLGSGSSTALRELLAPDLLLAVFWGGRGRTATGLLPPGLAPSRPLAQAVGQDPPELRIDPLPSTAPKIAITHDRTDPLVAGTVERLAVVLRSRGWALDEDGATAHAQLLRWRPPTLDPALALLALAGAHPDLLQDVRLADPALLDPDPDRRFIAVAEVELTWLAEGRVVPLMTADRWIAIDPDLRGVRLRPDGVPLLHEAWWSVPRAGRAPQAPDAKP
ncbi:MAG: hypothetical protein GY898_02700 [Proteobacteria bacterium]|nr:hypothetical protein [Pseudomonadota bacterium]